MQEFQVSATGHYVLSFVTSSEMERSPVTVARPRPARVEFIRARPVANDTAADIVCFAEFVILMFRAPMPTGPMQSDHIKRPAIVVNYGARAIYLFRTVLHN